MKEEEERIFYKTIPSGIECIAHPEDNKEIWEYVAKQRDSKVENITIPDEMFWKENVWIPDISITNINNSLNKLSLPLKPESFGDRYTFPEDIVNISMISLGQWMFKLASWRSYCIKILTFEELEYSVIKKSFDLGVSNKAADTEKKQEKRISKDFLVSSIILNSPVYKRNQIKLIEKEAKIKALQRLLEMYQIQQDCISRELSRRDLELKVSK